MQREDLCARCGKPPGLCFCARIEPMASRIGVVILQHPRESDLVLGTARITQLALANSQLKIGLSWPSLSKILDRKVESSRWGVLFLGSRKQAERPQGAPNAGQLDGIVALDGTWSQAKTLWWRNPWLLKLKRIVLAPKTPSLYGELRKEPRRECLSTIEAVAEALDGLGERPEVGLALRSHFSELLGRVKL